MDPSCYEGGSEVEDLKEEIKEFYEFFDYSWMKNIEEPWCHTAIVIW